MKYFSFSIVFTVVTILSIIRVDSSSMIVRNDGPITLGANITFYANLKDFSAGHSLLYTFDDGVLKSQITTESQNISLSRLCSSEVYKDGVYNMTVTVEKDGIFWDEKIATNYSSFQLKADLVGAIQVHQGNNTEDLDEVAVGLVTFEVELHDPSNYLNNSVFNYNWNIDGERFQTETNNSISYNFTDEGTAVVKTLVSALLPNNDYKIGIFEKQIEVKFPVTNINVTGNPFLHHGEILHLNVSCNGSSPFTYNYCWQEVQVNETSANYTCTMMATSNTCYFQIFNYFQNYGRYNISIYIRNDIVQAKKVIDVMIYNVTAKPTLSTVIVPIVCTLLALTIIVGGIAYFLQQRHRLLVEVADFDFQGESETYPERTFFEQIFDSLSCKSRFQSQLESGDVMGNENAPLLNNQPLAYT